MSVVWDKPYCPIPYIRKSSWFLLKCHARWERESLFDMLNRPAKLVDAMDVIGAELYRLEEKKIEDMRNCG